MREGTTLRVTATDRPYGEFYDFYSVSPENFGSTLISRTDILYRNNTKEKTLLHIHGNNGYVNVPQYYGICTLPIMYL